MLWDWLQSLCPRSAQGAGPDRLEGTCATGLAEFLCAWVLLVPVTPGVGDRCCVLLTSDPLILGINFFTFSTSVKAIKTTSAMPRKINTGLEITHAVG